MKDPETKFWNDNRTIREFSEYPPDNYWKKILMKVNNKKRKKALDLGCGGGRNTELLADLGFDTYACDYYEGMVEATKSRLKKKAKVTQADMKRLPYDTDFFDVVVANGIYHNLNSPENLYSAISETMRVLKRGGHLLVNIFTSDNLDNKSLTKKGKYLFETKNGMNMVLLSKKEIIETFETFGFTPVEEIQQYTRKLNVGKRSVLKTVLKMTKDPHAPFPKKPKSSKFVKSELQKRLKEIPDLDENSTIQRLGFAMTKPYSESLNAITKFINKNNNNVGIHTSGNQKLTGTRRLEQQSVNWLGNLLGDFSSDGYITSGGTEGNLMGAWIGREKLRANGYKKIVLLISPLTHISLTKATRILDIGTKTIPVDKNYSIDISELLKMVGNLKNNEGAILGLTAGYYSTGTSDNIPKICKVIEKLGKDNLYVHIDAAFGGFVYPFTDPSFEFDFRNKMVSSITVDPHKMGLMPYSCGVFLCRKGLLNYIEDENIHAGVADKTLIGSRPGATAAALWSTIASLGYSGYKKVIDDCVENKKYLIDKLKKLDKKLSIKSEDNINNFAVNFSIFKDGLLPKYIETKYRLVPNKLPSSESSKANKNNYHFYLMPHVSKKVIDRFIKDIQGKL
jgi:glutamate/tyrosine decarboxylase-like PLP-dependent enzyme/ubiquinone/menaquinone biosynthesis C-methylase UbiE